MKAPLSSSGRARRALLAGAGLLLALHGCAEDRSFALVTVRAADGEIGGVAQFVAYVWHGDQATPEKLMDVLSYPRSVDKDRFRLTKTDSVDFSVSFRKSYMGLLTVGVEAKDAGGNSLGYGQERKDLDPGRTIGLDIAIQRGALPPVIRTNDAGAGADATNSCNAVTPGACGATSTCTIGCKGDEVVGMCVAAGTFKPGEACSNSGDCEAGSQCFQYSCGAKVCARLCSTGADCTAPARCATAFGCGKTTAPKGLCSLPSACDPRGSAMAGCTGGFRCFLFDGEVTECDCFDEKTRIAEDGAACANSGACKPGMMCVDLNGMAKCRPLCRLDQPSDCAADRVCTMLIGPNYKTWGACLPR